MGKLSDWLASTFQAKPAARPNVEPTVRRNAQPAAIRQPAQPYRPAPPAQVLAPDWTSTAPTLRPEGYSSVAGESYHQDELRRHLAAAQPHRYVMAQLVRDRANPHHSGAVAVFVGPDYVGYVPRDVLHHEGQSLYQALARLDRRNVPATCWARLTGGTADRPNIGITLGVLEVAIDGAAIGRLSPKDTAARLGLVNLRLATRRPLLALARIRPSQGKRVKFICSVSVDTTSRH
ncbi:hypothetical protein [Flindersiella endophytica]